jgi:thiamine-phosphate pyrophosphorylase
MNNEIISPELLRVCDANLNRLKEGIRVIEDILRYKDNNKKYALELKKIRHLAKLDNYKELLAQRDSINDVLKPSTKSEQYRKNIEDIIVSNFKRAQESSRVLEEIFKLSDIKISEKFKSIRYSLYNLEKEILTI